MSMTPITFYAQSVPNKNTQTPTVFEEAIDSFVAWVTGGFITMLSQFVTEANTLYDNCNAKTLIGTNAADTAVNSAISAAASAESAFAVANAPQWVSGNPYQPGNVVWSPSNYSRYVRIVAGAGATDPSQDVTNWKPLSRDVSVTMSTNVINLASGNLFKKTITTATTLTVSNAPPAGVVGNFILEITNGGAGAITWWSGITWILGPPSLKIAGVDIFGFYTTDGGASWRCVNK